MSKKTQAEQTKFQNGRRRFMGGLALTAIAPLASLSDLATASDHIYNIVSPFAAGGTNDILSRLIAEKMRQKLGVSVIVENKIGANGNIASAYVARSAPDGHTLLMGNSATHGTNPTLYPNQPFDPIADFASISMIGSVPLVLIVDGSLGIQNMEQLLAYIKKNPGKGAFGSSGIGGTGHLCGEMFKAAGSLDIVHSPYKGDVPAAQDVMGGQLTMAFVGVGPAVTALQSGRVRAIAVTAAKRAMALPDVPTMEEAGFKNIEVTQWYALFTRNGTPQSVIDKLNAAIKDILASDDVKKKMLAMNVEPVYSTAEEMDAFYSAEIKRFRTTIEKLGIKIS